jgi:hypothetical protein
MPAAPPSDTLMLSFSPLTTLFLLPRSTVGALPPTYEYRITTSPQLRCATYRTVQYMMTIIWRSRVARTGFGSISISHFIESTVAPSRQSPPHCVEFEGFWGRQLHRKVGNRKWWALSSPHRIDTAVYTFAVFWLEWQAAQSPLAFVDSTLWRCRCGFEGRGVAAGFKGL